jgi:hypothetical protein
LETSAAHTLNWTKTLKNRVQTQNHFVFVQRIMLFSNGAFSSTQTWFGKKLLLGINPRAAGQCQISEMLFPCGGNSACANNSIGRQQSADLASATRPASRSIIGAGSPSQYAKGSPEAISVAETVN